MDLVGVWIDLGFKLFTLDIDQYLDVTDFCWIATRCEDILPLTSICDIILVLDY